MSTSAVTPDNYANSLDMQSVYQREAGNVINNNTMPKPPTALPPHLGDNNNGENAEDAVDGETAPMVIRELKPGEINLQSYFSFERRVNCRVLYFCLNHQVVMVPNQQQWPLPAGAVLTKAGGIRAASNVGPIPRADASTTSISQQCNLEGSGHHQCQEL